MALALNNLKRVDMPLNKETKPNQTKPTRRMALALNNLKRVDMPLNKETKPNQLVPH